MTGTDSRAERHKKSLLSGLLGGAKTVWAAAILAALVAAFIVLNILGEATARTTYYVLDRDIPARTQITPDMLLPVESTIEGAPAVALSPRYVMDNAVFSQVPLQAGDVLSTSTVAPLERINADLPEGFVVASVMVTPENAVAGKVRKGDYIDVIAVNGDDLGATAKVVLHHVLVLDVTVSPESIADAANSGQEGEDLDPGPESAAVRGGIPSLYTVAVSPDDAVKVALVRDKGIMIVLSANETTGTLDATTQLGTVFGQEPVTDSGEGTETAAKNAQDGTTATDSPDAPDGADPVATAPATPGATSTGEPTPDVTGEDTPATAEATPEK